ncbi:MAG TPA: flagellar biosynthetic protein FliO [Solirubrobacteraceae bacterium]|nr:flagellar biosynthetic protein FliO [Solirubrobacteraceae bacterium]
MIKLIPLPRAAIQAAVLALGVWLLAPARCASAFTPAHGKTPTGENVPLNLTPASHVGAHASSSGGASIVRTIVGLVIVLAVIWGLTWILRQVKTSRETQSAGVGLASVASLALGSGRTLHLVRAGSDYVLVGSAEQGVTAIHRYTQQQAREAGLLNPEEPNPFLAGEPLSGPARMAAQGAGNMLERMRGWTVIK